MHKTNEYWTYTNVATKNKILRLTTHDSRLIHFFFMKSLIQLWFWFSIQFFFDFSQISQKSLNRFRLYIRMILQTNKSFELICHYYYSHHRPLSLLIVVSLDIQVWFIIMLAHFVFGSNYVIPYSVLWIQLQEEKKKNVN